MKTNLINLKRLFVFLFLFFAGWVAYSQTPPPDLNGDALKTWLKQNFYDGKHSTLGYNTARMYMYNYIDNHNNTITGVYSGYQVSWTYGGTGTNPAPINCEHTVPQSYFGSAEPMKSDIHHLFPSYQNWNSTRSNYPFAEIDDNVTVKWMYLDQSQTSIPTTNIDLYSEYANSTFEPREDHKGDVARAIFYFYTMYPTQAGNISTVADPNTLYQWHLNDPVSAEELQRNTDIETYQGDKNPYIEQPDLVARAWGFTPTGPTVPAAPALALVSSPTSLDLSWNDVSNEDGYRIYRSEDAINYNLLAGLAANSSSYQDFAVSNGINYSYYIIAYNAQGNSNNSNIVSGQLQGGGGSGTASDLLISEYIEGSSYNKALEIANFTGSPIDLSGYSLMKQTNGAGSWSSELVLSGTIADGDVYVVANSSAGTEIQAVADLLTTSAAMSFNGNDPVALFKNSVLIDVVGNFNSTANYGKDVTMVRKSTINSPNTSYVTTEWDSYAQNTFIYLGSHTMDGGTSPDVEAPSVPTGLIASSITDNSFSLSWTASTDNIGVTGYDIYKDGVFEGSTASTNLNIGGLSAWTSYNMTVKAKDAAGNVSAASNVLVVTTTDTQAPSVPGGLMASNIAYTDFTVSWNASSDNVSVSGYDVYRDGVFEANTSQNTYDFTGLTEGTTYAITVRANDQAGNNSAFSTALSVTTNVSNPGGGPATDILISEYVEGSSYNKALEIANFTGADVDLSAYSIMKQTNGAGSWGSELALSGVLADGQVYVIANTSASSAITSVADLTTTSQALSFNGNDPVALFKNGNPIDVVGTFNSTANYGQDVTMVRNSNISSPGTSYNSADWTQYATDEFAYLGSHTMDGGTPTGPVELLFTDFESGFDIWKDGGGDCRLYTGGTYASQGSNAANIQDNSGTSSSFYLINGIDVASPGYDELTVDFNFMPISMENGEDFFVEYYDGSSWNIVASYARGTDFNNNTLYSVSVPISKTVYNFPTNMKLRFRCDASGNKDDIYIDEIRVTASTTTAKSMHNAQIVALGKTILPKIEDIELQVGLYPNPATDQSELKIDFAEEIGAIDIQVLDIQGRLILSQNKLISDDNYTLELNVSDFEKGIYLVNIVGEQFRLSKKLIVQ